MEAALRALVDRPFLKSPARGEQFWRANRCGMPPDLWDFERVFTRRMAEHGVPMFAHCVLRGREEQERLYAEGRSKAKWGESPHNFAMAFDFVHGTKAWDMTPKQWSIIGHIGKEIAKSRGLKVAWGGDWSFYDPAHWELADWRVRSAGKQPHGD
jgi:hypothetical protein